MLRPRVRGWIVPHVDLWSCDSGRCPVMDHHGRSYLLLRQWAVVMPRMEKAEEANNILYKIVSDGLIDSLRTTIMNIDFPIDMIQSQSYCRIPGDQMKSTYPTPRPGTDP